MLNEAASSTLRERIKSLYGDKVPGCVFHVMRNGEPFADGSFGWARLPGAAGYSQLEMSTTTLVHTGSVGKFICAAAILRLIQEWNWIIDNSILVAGPQGTVRRRLHPRVGMAAEDSALVASAFRHNAKIDLDTKVYPLLESFLYHSLIARYRQSEPHKPYPGANVSNITLRHLLTHTAGLEEYFTPQDFGGSLAGIYEEPGNDQPTTFNHSKITTALLKDAASPGPPRRYSNSAYGILSAVIEATTGQPFTKWTRQRLFPAERFRDIDRKPVDPARACRYYRANAPSGFTAGNLHPDYTRYSGAGGWYMSATQFCDWVDALMEKEPIGGGGPVLDNPEALFSGKVNFDPAFHAKFQLNGTLSDPQMRITGLLGLDGTINTQWWLNGASKGGQAFPGGEKPTPVWRSSGATAVSGYAPSRRPT